MVRGKLLVMLCEKCQVSGEGHVNAEQKRDICTTVEDLKIVQIKRANAMGMQKTLTGRK